MAGSGGVPASSPRRWWRRLAGVALAFLAASTALAAKERACGLLTAADVATILQGAPKVLALEQPPDGTSQCTWLEPASGNRLAVRLTWSYGRTGVARPFEEARQAALRRHAVLQEEPSLGANTAFSAVWPHPSRGETAIIARKGPTQVSVSLTGAGMASEHALVLLRPLARKVLSGL